MFYRHQLDEVNKKTTGVAEQYKAVNVFSQVNFEINILTQTN